MTRSELKKLIKECIREIHRGIEGNSPGGGMRAVNLDVGGTRGEFSVDGLNIVRKGLEPKYNVLSNNKVVATYEFDGLVMGFSIINVDHNFFDKSKVDAVVEANWNKFKSSRELVDALLASRKQKDLDEMTTTGAVAGYQTPFAFSKKGFSKAAIKASKSLGYTPVKPEKNNTK